MNDNYWRLIQLKKSLEILKGQENGTITRTEIDDMNRNIQITKLCYNDGYNEGFQKGKLEQKKEELMFLENLWKIKGRLPIEIFDRIEQLQKEIKVSGDSLTEFWDNSEDDRWDKEETQNKTINEQLDATSRSYEWEIKNTPSKRKRQNRRRKEGGKTR